MIPQLFSKVRLSSKGESSGRDGTAAARAPVHRHRSLQVLFVHRDAEAIDSCVQALEKAQFAVTFESALNLAQCAERLRMQPADVIVVEYPSPTCKESQILAMLHVSLQKPPVIFLTNGAGSESLAEGAGEGSFEYLEREHASQLPMAVRRLLNEKRLREELEDSRRALRHSQSLYRALSDNPTYGICRCNAEGDLIEGNLTLAMMLGYSSREELLTSNEKNRTVPNLRDSPLFTDPTTESRRTDPVEMEWRRKDGTILKVRLSGRGVYDDHGNFASHEIIVMDVTEQRSLEEQLRHEASSDSLTGLANHRRLFEVLQTEICRSKRTEREFSLLLLDLDGLKKINDKYGHVAGSRALCRLAQIVADCCRSIDTAARHGGDEFAVVLPETGRGAATLVGERICDLLAKDTEEPAISASVGAATYPSDAETIGTLLYAADSALYEMKERRRQNTENVEESRAENRGEQSGSEQG